MLKYIKQLNKDSFSNKKLAVGMFLVVITSTNALAFQIDTVDTQPYITIQPLLNYNGKSLKRQTAITKFNKNFNSINDTSSITLFNTEGKRASIILFKRNKRQDEYGYSYYKLGLKSGFMEISNEHNQATKRINDTIFNKDQTIAELTHKVVLKSDTAYRFAYQFTYDKSKRLVKKVYRINNSTLINYSELTYLGDKIQKIKFVPTPTIKNTYLETIFDYDTIGYLIKKEKFDVRNGIRKLINYNDYHYKNKKLIQEQYGTFDRIKDVTNTDYHYFDDGKLSMLTIRKDTLSKTITYNYNGALLSKVHGETNTTVGIDREFSSQIWLYREKSLPIKFDVEYLYDQKQNLIDTKYYVNGELRGDYQMQLEYY